jgi:hypothetical protein
VAWAFVWLLLLQGGWVPPHAVEAKHLGPLVLVPVLVIARAGSARSQAVRIAAAVVLAVSLLAQTPRSYRALCRSSDERLIASLRGAECLWVDTPRRGYLLPLVDKLPPDAQVVIAGPDLVRERREELDKLLPRSRLMYAEINEYPGQQRSPVQQEVVDRFSELYEAREVLKQGPRRTVTEFSRKRTATSSSPAE